MEWKQRGMVFIFPCYHICSPSYLSNGRFYGFFFPSGFGVGKKNRQLNWISTPNQGKKQTCLGFFHDFFRHGFFFSDDIPRENKKPLNYLLPSYFLGRSTVLYVITWKNKNHTPLVKGCRNSR